MASTPRGGAPSSVQSKQSTMPVSLTVCMQTPSVNRVPFRLVSCIRISYPFRFLYSTWLPHTSAGLLALCYTRAPFRLVSCICISYSFRLLYSTWLPHTSAGLLALCYTSHRPARHMLVLHKTKEKGENPPPSVDRVPSPLVPCTCTSFHWRCSFNT